MIQQYIKQLIEKGLSQSYAEEIAKAIMIDTLEHCDSLLYKYPRDGYGSAVINHNNVDKYLKTGQIW